MTIWTKASHSFTQAALTSKLCLSSEQLTAQKSMASVTMQMTKLITYESVTSVPTQYQTTASTCIRVRASDSSTCAGVTLVWVAPCFETDSRAHAPAQDARRSEQKSATARLSSSLEWQELAQLRALLGATMPATLAGLISAPSGPHERTARWDGWGRAD